MKKAYLSPAKPFHVDGVDEQEGKTLSVVKKKVLKPLCLNKIPEIGVLLIVASKQDAASGQNEVKEEDDNEDEDEEYDEVKEVEGRN
jgi:hypothetical protein